MTRARFQLRHGVTTSLWFIPVLCLLAGILVAVITIAVDRATDGSLLPVSLIGDPNAALAILSTAAASMVSLTALVLTITGVVVQLAMGQFSPRSVRPFLQDRPSQFAIGVFVGAFAHSMLALREVHSFGQDGYVPSLTIAVSFVLILASVMVLVAYVHHIGNSLKVDSIIRAVGDETRGRLEELFPQAVAPVEHDERTVVSDRAGYIFDLDEAALVEIAAEADARLEAREPIGTFVPVGAVLFDVVGDGGRLDHDAVRDAIAIGAERTMDRDPAYGIQTLVDIAQRSLTDSFNDATTASQAIDRIHDCLRLLVARELDGGQRADDDGTIRLAVPTLSWADYVSIAFDSLTDLASGTPPVTERIEAALVDLRSVAPDERRAALDERLAVVRRHAA